MDKQLIEQIAEVAYEDAMGQSLRPKDRREVVRVCVAFLARIDAERGKKAVAVVDFREQGWRDFVDAVRVLPDGTPLFLAPTIPEGMELVPIEPTQAMSEAALNTFIRTSAHAEEIDVDMIYKAMIASVQGERK